jgi:hypothetical protein
MARSAEVVLKEIDSLLDELHESLTEPAPAAVVCEQARLAGQVRDRVEAALTAIVGHLDTSGAYGDDGAVNARGWLSWALRLTKPAAARLVADSRALRTMPNTSTAYAAGHIGPAQVRLLRLAREVDTEVFARDEQVLVEQARGLRGELFARAIKHWTYLADPDGQENDARHRH